MAEEIEILVNRSPVRIASGTRLDVLIELLWAGAGLVSELVTVDAVHVPRDAWESVVLTPGARVETICY